MMSKPLTKTPPETRSKSESVRSREVNQDRFLKTFLTTGTVAGAVHLTDDQWNILELFIAVPTRRADGQRRQSGVRSRLVAIHAVL